MTLRAGASHTVLQHVHLVIALIGVARGPQHADIATDACDQERIDAQATQVHVELGANENAEAPLEDADVARLGCQLVDDLESLRAFDAERCRRLAGPRGPLQRTSERRLIWYNLPVWLWAILWPLSFAFTLWQIFMVGHLSVWESALMAVVLAGEAQAVFIVGHELVHRRAAWERRLGEFLLASASCPQYATEHVYIHHALVGTPLDVGSAPKGESIWRYFPRELASNIFGAWRVARERLARRRRPVWHYSNPFWRYGFETALWYALIYWMGDWWAVLIFAALCLGVVFSMKISNYIQHYGLRRIRLANGRFEKSHPRHSWSANCQFSNWMFYNMQPHPDHHAVASRQYALLQHHGEGASPQSPGPCTSDRRTARRAGSDA